MTAGNGVVLFDAGGNPVGLAANAAVSAAQPALVAAGSDYGATPKAQIPKVDAFGTLYTSSANPGGGSSQFYTGQPSPVATMQYGDLTMMRQDAPAPSKMVPFNADMNGNLNVHIKSKPTFRIIAPSITCAANKVLLTLTNASTSTMIIRLNEVSIYVPPSGSVGSGLLGSTNVTYYPVICELRRITTASGGAALSLATTDTTDSLAAGVACLSSPTTVSAAVSTFHRQDAYISTISGLPFFYRPDQNEKSLVLRAGEGLAVVCVSSGTINNANGTGTTTAAVDIVMVCTQAPA